MKDVFISIRGRVQVNAEALNMVESVGNYVKHRRIPVIHYKDGEYLSLYVPAVSGESLAHGYQETLSHIAQEMNLPVCKYCKQGIFLKSTNSKVYKASFNAQDVPKNDSELEKSIIKGCVVEDVGGFLFAEGGRSIKRTSNFYVGYMIPVREALEASLLESQLHTRYALGTEFVKEQGGQMIYYVELASAVYGFSFDLDTSYIGRSSFTTSESGGLVVETSEAEKRKEAALTALKEFLMEMKFGAKKTRYLPMHDWESIVVAVSDKVWTVPSPLVKTYIQRAKQKLENVNYNTKLYTYSQEEGESFEKVLSKAFGDALNRIKSQ
ncbi:MAG: type I-A CRISPR-associated protein Cas7/Csa2 [Desulfurococcales archaeon]|nr:type I-A CRISPR-associated protein Cas7/Csa2 [Desulfurococcales archaeon]